MTSEPMNYVRPEREPTTHELKTWQSYFHAVADGSKTFELRRDDRDFRVGDTLLLRETENGSGAYTGRSVARIITQILRHAEYLGLIEGFAILSLRAPVAPGTADERFVAAVRNLLVHARTSGGTAGRDDGLCNACAAVESILALPSREAPQPPYSPLDDGKTTPFVPELERLSGQRPGPRGNLSAEDPRVLAAWQLNEHQPVGNVCGCDQCLVARAYLALRAEQPRAEKEGE